MLVIHRGQMVNLEFITSIVSSTSQSSAAVSLETNNLVYIHNILLKHQYFNIIVTFLIFGIDITFQLNECYDNFTAAYKTCMVSGCESGKRK